MRKLTLNAEPEVIEQAKKLARRQNTSVSKMFSAFVRRAAQAEQQQGLSLTQQATGLVRLPKRKSDRALIEDALADRFLK